MTKDEITWEAKKDGWGLRYYVGRLADGTLVTIKKTGQRNGRVLGGAWRATTGWGVDQKTVGTGSTLAACKASVEVGS